MNLILPWHSVSASTGWGCQGRRTAAVGGDNGNGGPGTTGNIEQCGKMQKISMVLWLKSWVLPSGFWPDSRFRRILEHINLALEWFNSDVCSTESEVICKNLRMRKSEDSENWGQSRTKKNWMHNLGITPASVMVNKFVETTQNTNKTQLLACNYGRFR